MSDDNPFEEIYEDIDENGEIPMVKKKSMMEKALSANTDLERDALAATGRHYFASTKQKKEFKRYEDFAGGADPESRLWRAWLANRIMLVEKFRPSDAMVKLLSSFGNKVKRDNWFADNRTKVLAKPTVAQIASAMTEKMEMLQHADDDTTDNL